MMPILVKTDVPWFSDGPGRSRVTKAANDLDRLRIRLKLMRSELEEWPSFDSRPYTARTEVNGLLTEEILDIPVKLQQAKR